MVYDFGKSLALTLLIVKIFYDYEFFEGLHFCLEKFFFKRIMEIPIIDLIIEFGR